MFLDVIADVGRVIRICQRHVARAAFAPDAVLDEIPGLGHSNVRVNVHDSRAATANHNFPAFAAGNGS
jgi:hypothetical protein